MSEKIHKVVLIPGDGVGPELTEAARRCLEATGVKFDWVIQEVGEAVMKKAGTPLPDSVLETIRSVGVALKGPITTPVGTGFRSVNVALRQSLGLFACLRPCKSYEGVPSRYSNINLVIVRENTEDLYAGIEFQKDSEGAKEIIQLVDRHTHKAIRPDSGISIKPISVTGSTKIVEYAFQYAERHGRKKVTAVHKANIMKFSDGLFLEVARNVAKQHPSIQFEDTIVDNMCMQLVRNPENYDVLVLPNLYGDIISDLCAGLIGGLGVAPGANFGDRGALFEATHGSAPKYKGLNKVNPSAMIFSGILMLEHLGETEAAMNLDRAMADVIREGRDVTYDLKKDRKDPTAAGTKEMADAIIAKLNAGVKVPARR